MGRRSAQAEENHWPGFVDALSTIVMVVTFLLIILAIVIFVLSQSIAKSYIESKSEQTLQGGGDINSPDPLSATKEFVAEKAPEEPDPAAAPPQPTAAPSPSEAVEQAQSDAQQSESQSEQAEQQQAQTETPQQEQVETQQQSEDTAQDSAESQSTASAEGTFLTSESDQTLSEIPDISATEMAVESRKLVDQEERIIVKAPQEETEPEAVVIEAETILTLVFEPSALKIDENAANRVTAFVEKYQAELTDIEITVLSFTGVETTSVSQARRVAYYRALAARNELIKNGLRPGDIEVEIRFSTSEETHDTVQVVANP